MDKIKIKIKGMMCEGCENRVQNALKEIKGVENVEADHKTGMVMITGKNIEYKEIKETLEDLEYEILEEEK